MSNAIHQDMPGQPMRVDVGRIILAAIGMVGLVSLASAAPNALQIIRLFKKHDRRYRSPYYVNRTIGKLYKKGWIEFQKSDRGTFVRLTEKGKRELVRYQLKEKSAYQKRWDGKWRVVIFDVKERKRGTRDAIRNALKTFGFLKLQESVWAYPYHCEELIALLKADCHIGREVLYLVVETIENDGWLRKHFSLASK